MGSGIRLIISRISTTVGYDVVERISNLSGDLGIRHDSAFTIYEKLFDRFLQAHRGVLA